MKILFHGKALSREAVTGVERVSLELVRGLAALDGVEVHVVTAKPITAPLPSNVRIVRLPLFNDVIFALLFGLIGRIMRMDRIVTPHSMPCFLPLGIRQAVCIHDIAWRLFKTKFTRTQLAYFHFIHLAAAKIANLLYCPSESTARDMSKFYKVRGRIEVIPWGGDHFNPVGPELAEEEFRNVNDVYLSQWRTIITLGTLQPRKGYLQLIAALSRTPIKLLYIIFGSKGWLSDDIIVAIDNFNRDAPNGSHILWIRGASDALVSSALSSADLFILASEYEGFGIPVIEAMRCGSAVAVADNSSLAEIIAPNQWKFATGDVTGIMAVVAKALGDPIALAEQRRISLRRSRDFTWHATAVALAAALRAL